MSVKITGMKKLLADLDKKIGAEKMARVSDAALMAGAKVFVEELRRQFESFKDTGASLEEITISKPMLIKGVRTIKVHWRGPKGRYRIIHLNEWGTVKNPNPKGKGAVARALRNSEKSYRKALMNEIRRDI